MDAWAQVFAPVANSPVELAVGIAALGGIVLFLALWRTSLRLGFALAGDPEAGGSFTAWARLGPVRIDWRKHSGEPARSTLRILGIRLGRRRVSRPRRKKSGTAPKPAKAKNSSSARAYFLRHWNLAEVGSFAWKRRRDIRFSPLKGRVEFGFAEPERTGDAYGALCVLTGVIPPLRADAEGSVRTADFALSPDWSLKDRLAGDARAEVQIRVVRAGIASLFFLLTHWHPARRRFALHA
ncbi:MAG: hypothetical protein VX574_04835 [Myxococcota bacterium]|nr:hypothetical protein [Myxococcota bacterium]